MAKGGKRAGSGRKKGIFTIEREKMKEYIATKIAEQGESIVQVLIDKALDGDIAAIKELFDRGFGKATQGVDVTSKGERLSIDDNQLEQLIRARTTRTDNDKIGA